MAACENPKFIDTTNVNYFGFITTFYPFSKSVNFNIDGITTFKTGGAANISSISFVVKNITSGITYSPVVIDPSDGEDEVTLTGLEQGTLYFGQYQIIATLTEADASTHEIEMLVNVCADQKLNNKNLAVGCAVIEVNCSTAKMVIKEAANLKYAGKVVDHVTTLGTVNYPIDPETSSPFLDPVQFTYTPYSLSLANSITGLYSIALITTAYYDLGCESFLAIQYRSNVNKEVLCGNGMCEITCCMTDAVKVIEKGGSKAAQMEELFAQAMIYYVVADQKASCGENNDYYVKKVKEILNCDCKCTTKSLLIQPNPITFGASNLIPACGMSITEDENGDYVFSTLVYRFEPAAGETKISFETIQINACTRVTYATIHCAEIERCIYNILATKTTILNQWKELFGIKDCPCDDVDISNGSELGTLYKASSDFNVLDPLNFVKNDVIIGVEYNDSTTINPGTIDYVKYTDQIIQQMGVLFTAGGNINLPSSVCGESIADLAGYKLIKEAVSTCGCTEVTACDLDTPRVDYGERYGFAYRFNPQIEEPNYTTYTEIINGDPYTMYKVYFGETENDGSWSSVRILIIKKSTLGVYSLHETRTIIGKNFNDITTATTNNTWGDMVGLNRPSSINLDFDEIVNGEPVLYFVTFGGYICRAVRERDSQCDERANWKVYVIANTSNNLYGMKKFIVDVNGNRSFIYFNYTTSKLMSLTYDNVGTKNDSANWTSSDILVDCIGVGANFNVELTKSYIFTLETGRIKLVIYSGGTSLAGIANPASYTEYTINGTLSATATSYIDGTNSVGASVWQPTWMQKITVGAEVRYYFGNSDTVTGTYSTWSYVRYVVQTGGDPTLTASWTFYTDIVVNANSILDDGSWNPAVSSNANGASQGMLVLSGSGSLALSMFISGVKTFDFTNKVVTIFSGQPSAGANLAQTTFMDSQYFYELGECEGGGSDE